MSDKIQIIITRGCDTEGIGGTVIDAPSVVLGALGTTPLLDIIVLAFAEMYPIAMVPGATPEDPQVLEITPVRNVSYQVRRFINEVVDGWRANKKRADSQALTTAEDKSIKTAYRVKD